MKLQRMFTTIAKTHGSKLNQEFNMFMKVISMLFFTAFAMLAQAATAKHMNSTIQLDEAKQEIEKWISFIERTPSDLSCIIADVDQYNHKADSLKQSIKKSVSVITYWLEMMPFESQLSDGGLSISPSKLTDIASHEQLANSGVTFPFKVAFQGNDLLIKSKLNDDPTILRDYKISRINGMPIEEVLMVLKEQAPQPERSHGENETQRMANLASRFSENYLSYFGHKSQFFLDVAKRHTFKNLRVDAA